MEFENFDVYDPTKDPTSKDGMIGEGAPNAKSGINSEFYMQLFLTEVFGVFMIALVTIVYVMQYEDNIGHDVSDRAMPYGLVYGAIFGGLVAAASMLSTPVQDTLCLTATFNPALTVVNYIRRYMGWCKSKLVGNYGWDNFNVMLVQIIGQMAGGSLAALIAWAVHGSIAYAVPKSHTGLADGTVMLYEGLATCGIAVAFFVTSGTTRGLAVGGFTLGLATTFHKHTGSVFNPAIDLGIRFISNSLPTRSWAWSIGPLEGALLAAILVMPRVRKAIDERRQMYPTAPMRQFQPQQRAEFGANIQSGIQGQQGYGQ